MRNVGLWLSLLWVALSLSACRNIMYSTYEKFGVYKRDLLRKQVAAARDEQKQTQQEFKDTLTRLKEMTGFEDPQVERGYRRLQSDYDEAARRVGDVHKRIQDVETVAKDLFTEWEKENREIGTDSLRQVSRRQLDETRERYEEMIVLLKKVERSMDPVLRKLHDYVLTLKHNLNTQAIASLKGESARIETDIGGLIRDMNVAIEQADAFVRQMPK